MKSGQRDPTARPEHDGARRGRGNFQQKIIRVNLLSNFLGVVARIPILAKIKITTFECGNFYFS